MIMEKMYYILKGKAVEPCEDGLTWSMWFQDADRCVGDTETEKVRVSTVFLGLNHNFEDGPPLIFETLVFGGDLDGEMRRYSTWEEAENGHKKMCASAIKNQ